MPRYLDGAIEAFRAGLAGPDLHLGYWGAPPGAACSAAEFTAAQAALTRQALRLAAVAPGMAVLDVACGLGGTLRQIGDAEAVGVNLDVRQLRLCGGGRLAAADACALPFANASFDRVLCLEAMFHFESRATFLGEAARVLRRGGTLMATDVLLRPPAGADAFARALREGYGPWPALWLDLAEWQAMVVEAGFAWVRLEDWTAETLPSYRFISPAPPRPPWDAGRAMRWLHEAGCLTYVAGVARRL